MIRKLGISGLMVITLIVAQLGATKLAAANTSSGYGLWTDWIFIGAGPISVQHEVFIDAYWLYVSGDQIEIYDSPLRICMKYAQDIYNSEGHYASFMLRYWYVYRDGQGEIDSDSLGGSTSGYWPACGTADWWAVSNLSINHFPPSSTRVEIKSNYCLDDGEAYYCAGTRQTFTSYMQ
ncbi:MAG TPA: hypothetical protein DCK98_01490 [Chloroflexi bacterium]|jgi:hypothetical protein|nr:hypothetical protein [Chloroflexota bacterium]HAL25825.1 hypothetical protein [Chloroflexota bacterium]